MKKYILLLFFFLWFNGVVLAQKPATKTDAKKPTETKKPAVTPKPSTPTPNNNTKPNTAKPAPTKPANPGTPKPAPAVKQEPPPPEQHGVNLELFTMDLALNAGIPVGFTAASCSFTSGLSYHLDYHISKKFSFGTKISYELLFAKKSHRAPTYYFNAFAEASYNVLKRLHIDAGIGYASYFGTSSPNPFFPGGRDFRINSFGWCAGFGYRFSPVFDAALRFQFSTSIRFIGLRLAFCFSRSVNNN